MRSAKLTLNPLPAALRATALALALVCPAREAAGQANPEPAVPSQDERQSVQVPAAELSVAAELERARSLYQGGDYDRCTEAYAKIFGQPKQPGAPALETGASDESLEQGRIYYASCLLAEGKTQEADAELRAALTLNPLMASPDLVLFPPQVRDLFFNVKGSFLEEIRIAQEEQLKKARAAAAVKERLAALERARIARLEQLAQQETVVSKNRRWVASIPFGVGQFQNGDSVLGSVFLVSEGALVATAFIAVSRELSLHSQADGGKGIFGGADFISQSVATARGVSIWALGSFVLIAATGIAEAHINFVEEEQLGVRQRALPPLTRTNPPIRAPRSKAPRARGASAEPMFFVTDNGTWLGLRGSF